MQLSPFDNESKAPYASFKSGKKALKGLKNHFTKDVLISKGILTWSNCQQKVPNLSPEQKIQNTSLD